MPDFSTIQNDFLSELTAIVEKNVSNEQFGVSELANEMNMSRSNLLRKVKKETKLSVSQLISQVRLKRGMEILRKSSLNVSEVSHQVGFSSTSYFIKCFREYYGYPPGEVGKRDVAESNSIPTKRSNLKRTLVILGSALLVIFAIGLLGYNRFPAFKSSPLEKSVAVLPFINDSNDSSNVYLINGLMESTLINLQKIKDLKVVSRTSAEKYRNTSLSIPEMARQLNVSYFVEGSGQKIGDQILLNIQLIEGSSDRHLWARQYKREAKDIFALQEEVAKSIAQEIHAIITPEEVLRIEKTPTHNLLAYDFYLKGRNLLYTAQRENMEEAIPYFQKAIEQDSEFALAYADATMTYYYLDIFQTEKRYASQISSYADKAFLFDSKLGESLVAKALSYMYKKEYELALPYLEKAMEYNPNSGLVINLLSDFYNYHVPNSAKYLEYALKGIRLNIASLDSINASHNYLHVGNALIQNGFTEEAMKYIHKSLAYNPKNSISEFLEVMIGFARDRNLIQTKDLLLEVLKKDTTNLINFHEVGKFYYLMRDYESSYQYYKTFIELREAQHLDLFKNENLKMAIVLSKTGHKEKSEVFIKSFKDFADDDRSIYKHWNQAMYYSHLGESKEAIEHLKLFAKEDSYQYWTLLFRMDPVFDAVKDLPEFKKVMGDIETRFWDNHKKIRVRLEEQGLL